MLFPPRSVLVLHESWWGNPSSMTTFNTMLSRAKGATCPCDCAPQECHRKPGNQTARVPGCHRCYPAIRCVCCRQRAEDSICLHHQLPRRGKHPARSSAFLQLADSDRRGHVAGGKGEGTRPHRAGHRKRIKAMTELSH